MSIKYLSAITILLSFPTFLVFANSQTDVDFLFAEGLESLQSGNLDKATSYFDQVLEIEPNHIGALNHKGSILVEEGKNYEALSYFNKVLKTDPNNTLAKKSKDVIKNKIRYALVEGSVEIIIRDSQGYLVGHLFTPEIVLLRENNIMDYLQSWEVKDTITKNGQKYLVLQKEKITLIKKFIFLVRHFDYNLEYDEKIPIVSSTYYYGTMHEKGDEVTTIFTILKQIN